MGGFLTRWMFSTASVVGRSHERMAVACQDVVVGRRDGGVAAVVLADGAGSASHSERGAQLAVSATIELLTSSFDALYQDVQTQVQERIIKSALSRIAEAADAAGLPIAEFASTLIFVAVKNDRFVAGHVGDGVIGRERDGHREVLSHPQRGEHVNETVFVTSRSATSNLAVERGDTTGVTAFAVMSDGAAESLYLRAERTLAPALTSMWGWLDAHAPEVVDAALGRNIRDQLRVSTGDDCSLGVLRRVTVMPDQLSSMNAAFTRAFLECRSPRGVRNRLAVLTALHSVNGPMSVADVSVRSSLSASTVRRHAQYLRKLEEPPSDSRERTASVEVAP